MHAAAHAGGGVEVADLLLYGVGYGRAVDELEPLVLAVAHAGVHVCHYVANVVHRVG